MPNRDKHVMAGALAGVFAVEVRAGELTPAERLVEMAGGTFGGLIGGRLPDLLEPATWPGHRKIAHSALIGAVLAVIALKNASRWEKWLRDFCDRERSRLDNAGSGIPVFVGVARIAFGHAAVGLLSGFCAGYMSHLLLDSKTPRGLPLV